MANVQPAPQEEVKMLGEALNTVKVQVQQMKRHLVRLIVAPPVFD